MKRTRTNRRVAGDAMSWALGVTLGLILGVGLLIAAPRIGNAAGEASPSAEGTIVSGTGETPGEAGTEGGGGTGAVQSEGGEGVGETDAAGGEGTAAGGEGATQSTGATQTGAGAEGGGGAAQTTGGQTTGAAGTQTQEGGTQAGATGEGTSAQAQGENSQGTAPNGTAEGTAGQAQGNQPPGATGAAGENDEEASGNPDTRSVAEQTSAGATVAPQGDSAADVARAEGTADDVNSFAPVEGGSGLTDTREIVDGDPNTTGEGTLEDNPDEVGGNPESAPQNGQDGGN
ncbi:hypothetical protein V3W47_17955 [Deinococcus sp. YIM 134068]|uniref:hypothetical protein n=1 Tax=Deinococcus lichenicola TaxID=3118910 RepID=UPI002F95495E